MLTQDDETENKYFAKITPESMARETERLRSLARHNEASALRHARDEERKKWQKVIANKDAVISSKNSIVVSKDRVITSKEAVIVGKNAEIARLLEQLEEK